MLFALQGLLGTKTSPLEVENFPEPLPIVAFLHWLLTEAPECCWLAVVGSQVHLEVGTKHRSFSLGQTIPILYNFKLYITIITTKSGEAMYWLMCHS